MILDMTVNVAYAGSDLRIAHGRTCLAWPQRKKKHELWLRTRTWWVIIVLLGLSIALPSGLTVFGPDSPWPSKSL